MSKTLFAFIVCMVPTCALSDLDVIRNMANNACAKVALKVVSNILDNDDDYDQLIALCNTRADPNICWAAVDMIKENQKKSPLNCRLITR